MDQKRGHRLITEFLSVLNDLRIFFAERFLGKFAVKRILEIPPHLACVATLPLKQAMNDKLQGSVATYSSCGGVVNNQKFERFIAECVSCLLYTSPSPRD